jgi:hypothetical protein
MTDVENSPQNDSKLFARFPSSKKEDASVDRMNPAIRLYGRRFYKDQTPVEYLAEFLLVFASEKGKQKNRSFRLNIETDEEIACYWPNDRIALKLFSFFPSSKLETRHLIHQKTYLQALEDIKVRISGADQDKDETVRLLQSLFGGFVGVARNRTWVTHSFLPASSALLAREVDWLHSQAVRDPELNDWEDAAQYFATDRHNFMARGGELLFLQLAHLFSGEDHTCLDNIRASRCYNHLAKHDLIVLKEEIEKNLKAILEDAVAPITQVASFIEEALGALTIDEQSTRASLGWVPAASISEAFLFATEMNNICRSAQGDLDKIDLLQTLVCMQVLRSLCFQAQRADDPNSITDGFIGGYSWIATDANAPNGSAVRKLAQHSFEKIEEMLYRVLRRTAKSGGGSSSNLKEADKHGFQIFRKIGKELELVIPRNGGGQRFALTPKLLRFLVAALVGPGERVRLSEFYGRIFAHFGIALGDRQLVSALGWSGSESDKNDYSSAADTSWVEEALQQGGFLVELSDAVSIVCNPDGRELV